MDQAEKDRTFEFLKRLTRSLAGTVGSMCEVVVHDFSNPEHSVIAIENGHVTGRKMGDSFGVFGLQVLRDSPKEDLINYRTTTKDGKHLRSSSLFLRDENGEMFGAMCVNLDLTQILKAQRVFEDLTSTPKGAIDEGFETSVDEALDLLIRDAVRSTRKEVSAMDREDKVHVIAYLENKGAFLIRYSIDRVAQSLNVSKFTVYNYLEELKSHQEKTEAAIP
jgi:predicted transcriptional regulator YheO